MKGNGNQGQSLIPENPPSQISGQQELNEKVARLCGWTIVVHSLPHRPGRMLGEHEKHPCAVMVPDYCNDLNACAELRQKLTAEECFQYTAWLCRFVKCANVDAGWRDLYACANATATDHCRAFIAVMEGRSE